jgi:hypothetical protein
VSKGSGYGLRHADVGAGKREPANLRSLAVGTLVLSSVLSLSLAGSLGSNVAAAPALAASCAAGYGSAGQTGGTQAATVGGNGCVVIAYVVAGTTYYETFNYTGATQSWVVPAGVDIATFTTYGAGGGGNEYRSGPHQRHQFGVLVPRCIRKRSQ